MMLQNYLFNNVLPKPSPSPKTTLQIMSNRTDWAKIGVITVLIDHNKTANINTILHPKRLAVFAPII